MDGRKDRASCLRNLHDQTDKQKQDSQQKQDYDAFFAKRMHAAGITHEQRIGVAVSGGPDSMALCILLSRWRRSNSRGDSDSTDKFVGFVVDHDLRANSGEEALLVQRWVSKLGVRCEVLKCLWSEGVPTKGHLQEAARIARYDILKDACKRERLEILLTAHHGDDQVCREADQSWVEDPTNSNLSFLRNKIRKVLRECQMCTMEKELHHAIALCRDTRAILDKARNELINATMSINQEYGYITLDLGLLRMKSQNNAVLCRAFVAILQFIAQKDRPPRGRMLESFLENIQKGTFKGAVTLGGCYVCPAPGSKGSRLLICFSSESPKRMTAGTMVQILPQNPPSGRASFQEVNPVSIVHNSTHELSELDVRLPFLNVKDSTSFLDEAKQLGILSDFSRGVLSNILRGLSGDFDNKGGRAETGSYQGSLGFSRSKSKGQESLLLPFGHSCYFMDRFLITWGQKQGDKAYSKNASFQGGSESGSSNGIYAGKIVKIPCYLMQERPNALVRYLNEKDWLWLASLEKAKHAEKPMFQCTFGPKKPDCLLTVEDKKQVGECVDCISHDRSLQWSNCFESVEVPQRPYNSDLELKTEPPGKESSSLRNMVLCGDYVGRKAQEALARLKIIPIPARRGLPVLITAQGALLGIPSINFNCCPHVLMSSSFLPRVPLGGGYTSWQ